MSAKYKVGKRFVVACNQANPDPDSAWTNYCFSKHLHLAEVRQITNSSYLVLSITYDEKFSERLSYECKTIEIDDLNSSLLSVTHPACCPKGVRKGTIRLYIATCLGTSIDQEIQLAKKKLEKEIRKAKRYLGKEAECIKSIIDFYIEEPDRDYDLDGQAIYGSFLSKSGTEIDFNYM